MDVEIVRTHWMLVAGLIVALGAIYFVARNKVRSYAARVKRDLEEYVKPPQQNSLVPLPIPPPNPEDTATVSDQKQSIWQAIHKFPMPPYEQIQALVHRLASAQVDLRFQDVYFRMFGSQQFFLEELNKQMGSGTMTRGAAQEFLQKLGEKDERIKAHNFNNWVGFLVDQGFVTVGVDTFTLTKMGQDVLVWVTRRQLPKKVYEGI